MSKEFPNKYNPTKIAFWLAVDIWINVNMFRGNDETMSGRMGRVLDKGDKGCCRWRHYLCVLLSRIDPAPNNHCINSIRKDDDGKAL